MQIQTFMYEDIWWTHVSHHQWQSETNMLSIWAGPDSEDIYDSFNLQPDQANDVDHVLQRFKEFCEPICNFRAAWYKFTKVSQHVKVKP